MNLDIILQEFSNEWARKILSDVDGLTEERVDDFVHCFLKDAKEDLLEQKGWPNILSAYKVSKAALNAHTRIFGQKVPIFVHQDIYDLLSWHY